MEFLKLKKLINEKFVSRITILLLGVWIIIISQNKNLPNRNNKNIKKPKITRVIKQVCDGLESFAFHPNGKMAVATCLEKTKNSLAVLDISDENPKVLYYLDAAGGSQGVEFTPEGDKLFLGSPAHGRIEVYDVVGEFELIKNQKFLKVGYGHNSLSISKKYEP